MVAETTTVTRIEYDSALKNALNLSGKYSYDLLLR